MEQKDRDEWPGESLSSLGLNRVDIYRGILQNRRRGKDPDLAFNLQRRSRRKGT